MRTVNGSPRGDSDLRAIIKALNDKIDLLSRRISRMPKIPEAVTSSGGIVGMAQIVSTSGSVGWSSGTSEMDYELVTYGTPSDPNAGGGGESSVAVSSWLTVSGHQITVDEGWYIPVLYARVVWDDPAESPPAFGGPFMFGGWDSVHNDYGIHAATPYAGGRQGFVQIANYGPTFMGAGTDLHAEVRAIGANPTGDNDPSFSSVVWDITKLG